MKTLTLLLLIFLVGCGGRPDVPTNEGKGRVDAKIMYSYKGTYVTRLETEDGVFYMIDTQSTNGGVSIVQVKK